MKYYTLHINDSGAIEFCNEKVINNKKTLICKLYNDKEFNALNDVLFSYEYVVNNKTSKILKQHNIIPFELTPVVLKKVKLSLGIFNIYKSHHYQQFKLKVSNDSICYDWINFEKSEIKIFKDDILYDTLNSHENFLKLVIENKKNSNKINDIYASKITEKEKIERTKGLKSFSFKSERIVFNKSFDTSVDMFKIPLYSSGTYISERLKEALLKNKTTDIWFAESNEDLNKIWKPFYPKIDFQ